VRRRISIKVGCAARTDSTPWCARRTLRGLAGACLFAITSVAGAANLSTDLHRTWSVPRATEFADASARLTPAIATLCATSEAAESALRIARRQWLDVLTPWERLSAVAIGPVLERRSQRQIDFMPTRPHLIEKAIKAEPTDPAAMELVGTPAKGLPALEWLLWVKPVQPDSKACRYALQVADEIAREAKALAVAPVFASDDAGLISELVNQWVGGLERLRWTNLEMPARVALTSAKPAEFPRAASGAAAAAWVAQWRSLRELATDPSIPVSLELLLRQRGASPTAEALAQAVRRADVAMHDLDRVDLPRLLEAARQLAALKRLVEEQVAPALGVNIGFSDSDGD
jgi:uncharacterized protein